MLGMQAMALWPSTSGQVGTSRQPKKGRPSFFADDLKQLLGLVALELILREKEHANAIFPLCAQGQPLLGGGLLEEFVADLRQNADAVAGLALGVLARAVLQMLHDLQRVVNGFVALAPLDVHHSADAAVVMLKPGAVQPGGGLALGKVFHTSFAPFPIPLNRAASHICRAGGIKKRRSQQGTQAPLWERLCSCLHHTIDAAALQS